MGISAPSNSASAKAITGFDRQADEVLCRHADGGSTIVPLLVGRYLEIGDRIATIGSAGVLIDRCRANQRSSTLYASISHVSEPKQSKRGEWFVRAELAGSECPLTALLVSGDALRRYFYMMEPDESHYSVLGCTPDTQPDALRIAWRLRNLELQACSKGRPEYARVERAFNILAHPDLRRCYDQLRVDENAAPLFPYGGSGSLWVEGDLADDGAAFFGRRIITYMPAMEQRKVFVPLRACEFLPDRIDYQDPRRRIELSIDETLLPEFHWDATWNSWGAWLSSSVEVTATFVKSDRIRFHKGEREVRTWLTAIPSRMSLRPPADLSADIEQARAIRRLLGDHVEVIERIRREAQRHPIEHSGMQSWFDELGVPPELRPEHAIWQRDFDAYYFNELRNRATTWFLFRQEFLFVLPTVIVSEVPKPGHATYVFAKPAALDPFMTAYSKTTRDEIRRNRGNKAVDLGFIGRVVRGRQKKRWLSALLRLV
ncbi:MAG: J domain-containing protein, partial [Bacteroidetes bacterium]|nr:J domain-containing protein [Bacteroidota bacterium]